MKSDIIYDLLVILMMVAVIVIIMEVLISDP